MRLSKSNSAALPALEKMLAGTASANMQRGRRRAPSLRQVAAVGMACMAVGGTAVAADIWNPEFGANSVDGPATTSATPVPAELSDALGVLRRDPTDQDRSAAVEATATEIWGADGVRPDSVRYLGTGAGGKATILLSAEDADVFRSVLGKGDPLCVYRPTADVNHPSHGVEPACFELSEVTAGHAYAEFIDLHAGLAFGLVPDGVAAVTVEFASAPAVTIPVADNYFEVTMDAAEVAGTDRDGLSIDGPIERIVWRDADGAVIPQQAGERSGEPLFTIVELPPQQPGS